MFFTLHPIPCFLKNLFNAFMMYLSILTNMFCGSCKLAPYSVLKIWRLAWEKTDSTRFDTATFPCTIVKTLERRKPSCEFCLVTEKNCQVLNFAEPEMPEFACIWDFLWRSNTGVLQDKKITKVRKIGHLRLAKPVFSHATLWNNQLNCWACFLLSLWRLAVCLLSVTLLS